MVPVKVLVVLVAWLGKEKAAERAGSGVEASLAHVKVCLAKPPPSSWPEPGWGGGPPCWGHAKRGMAKPTALFVLGVGCSG